MSTVYKYPCACCMKPVKNNQKGLKCTKCNQWLHIFCAGISSQIYDDPSEDFFGWQCNICILKELPFYDELERSINPESNDINVNVKANITRQDTSRGLYYHELQGNGFKIAHLNVNSLLKHIDEVRAFVKSNNIQVFAVNETKIDASVYDDEVMIDNFNLCRKDRSRQGGGVAIYLHKSIHFEQITHETLDVLEAMVIKVYIKFAKPLVVSTWYRPPSSDVEIFNLYERFLSFIDTMNCDIILTGDVNCDLLAKPLSSTSKKYMEINNIYSLVQVNINEATRITNTSGTLIDHLLTNSSQNVKSHGVIHNGMSDHSVSFLFGIPMFHHILNLSTLEVAAILMEMNLGRIFAVRNGSI